MTRVNLPPRRPFRSRLDDDALHGLRPTNAARANAALEMPGSSDAQSYRNRSGEFHRERSPTRGLR